MLVGMLPVADRAGLKESCVQDEQQTKEEMVGGNEEKYFDIYKISDLLLLTVSLIIALELCFYKLRNR